MDGEGDEQNFPIPFGKYLLTDLLAVGGMAEVYRAKIFGASGFEKEMVVKRILPKYAKNPNFVQMLIDEAKIAVNLTHGNIVPIYELGEFEGSYYIAMEYVVGQTILDLLRLAHSKKRHLDWQYAVHVCAGVAAGLGYAHSRKRPDGSELGLVHRDINPRNIVVTVDGEVKILDFGIARASTKKHQTASGVIKGTPGYMSPEQMNGQAVDSRSDIYCAGILLHELLTLRRLFPVWTVKEMRTYFADNPPLPPSELAPELPKALDEVVLKSLAADPQQRYQTADEFEEALRSVVAKSGVATTDRGLAQKIEELQKSPIPALDAEIPGPVADDGDRPGPGPEAPTSHETPSSSSNSSPPAPAPPPAEKKPPPQTEAMEGQRSAPLPAGDENTFVIALASDPPEKGAGAPRPLEPLPRSSHSAGPPKTNVLAQNADLSWSASIGNDAELLALARASAVAPGQLRNRFAIVAAAVVVLLVPVLAFYGPDLVDTVGRAIEGKTLRPGALVAKTRPSGAEVILDGKSRGQTNLKLTGVDPDSPHQLVIKPSDPPGMDPIVLEITPADFKPEDGLPTYTFDRDFASPEKEPEEDKPKDKPKKRKKKKRRR